MVNTIELNHSAHSETRPQRAKILSGAESTPALPPIYTYFTLELVRSRWRPRG